MPKLSRPAAPNTEAITVLVPRAKKKTSVERLELPHQSEGQVPKLIAECSIAPAPGALLLTDDEIDALVSAEIKAYRAEKAAARNVVR